jgi:hypothetical protein
MVAARVGEIVIGFSGIKDIAILYQKANSWTRLRFF